MQAREAKIYARLSRIDTVTAHNLFATSLDSFRHLQFLVGQVQARATSQIPGGKYQPRLDNLLTSLIFLNQFQNSLNQTGEKEQLQVSILKIHQLEGKMSQVEQVQQFIQQRKQLLSQALSKYGSIFSGDLKQINQESY